MMKKILFILLLTTASCVTSKNWFKLYTDEVETYEFINSKDSSIIFINKSNLIDYVYDDEFWITHELKRIVFKDVKQLDLKKLN